MRGLHATSLAAIAIAATLSEGCLDEPSGEEERENVDQSESALTPTSWPFVRGDANRDGTLDISDAIFILSHINQQSVTVLCDDALDADDNGQVTNADAEHVLDFLFNGTVTMPGPYPHAGFDRTADTLGCGVTAIDPRKSLAVTDVAVLEPFTFKRVMDKLVSQSGETGLTAQLLYQRLLANYNTDCQDIDGFPQQCPRAEANLASTDPFSATSANLLRPIGLFNRFDLAPSDGSHCGEHRIIFGKKPVGGRFTIIFEAQLPNPHPEKGLEGCRPVVEWWASLSDPRRDAPKRRSMLESLYFTGVNGFSPVVHIAHLAQGTGQIRTNNFVQFPWTLRELKLVKSCPSSGCRLDVAPERVKGNPFKLLFNPGSTLPPSIVDGSPFANESALRTAFQSYLVGQVQNLIATDFFLGNDDRFNAAESVAGPPADSYPQVFQGASNPSLKNAIQTELARLGSNVTPDTVVQRAQLSSCAGCHTQRTSIGFVQVNEQFTIVESGVERWAISNQLRDELLPAREKRVEDFLVVTLEATTCCSAQGQRGCSDDSVEACVCAADSFCCNTRWDSLCVREVESLGCGACGG